MVATGSNSIDPSPVVEPPASGGLGARIEGVFLRVFQLFINSARDTVRGIIRAGLIEFMDLLHPGAVDEWGDWIAYLRDIEDMPPELAGSLDKILAGGHEASIIGAAGVLLGSVIGVFAGAMAPVARKMEYKVDRSLSTNRPPAGELLALLWRGAITAEKYDSYLQDEGYEEELRPGLEDAVRPRANPSDLAAMLHRGLLTSDEFQTELQARGYTEEEAGRLEELSNLIPSPTDLIQMAVREAWDSEAITRFRLDSGFPEPLADWSEKQGLSRDWAEKYWIAHWKLPSLQMGYEMLHRGVISLSDMRLLIRTADISPFWRDKLIRISYSPYTRVDVRRMYAAKVIDETAVKRTYLDLGHDEEHATRLTEWTTAASADKERDLTKSDVLGAYRDSVISRTDAKTMLVELGYRAGEAEILLARIDHKLAKAKKTRAVSRTRKLFMAGEIDKNGAVEQLGKQNLPSTQATTLINTWHADRKTKTARPPASTIESWFVNGVITEPQYRELLSARGYGARYVEFYVKAAMKKKVG